MGVEGKWKGLGWGGDCGGSRGDGGSGDTYVGNDTREEYLVVAVGGGCWWEWPRDTNCLLHKKKNSSCALTLATIGEVNGTKGKRSS